MNQKKKIMLLVNQLHGGGAQKVIANLSRELVKQYDVLFVIYNDVDKLVFPFAGKLVKVRLPYAQNPAENSAYSRFIRFVVLIYRLRRIKKRQKIDVSISFMEASNIVNVLSRRNEKLVLSVRNYLTNEFKDDQRTKVFGRLIKRLYNRASHVIAASELIKDDLVQNFKVHQIKVKVIYNFIDKDFLTLHKEKPIEDVSLSPLFDFPLLINIGRLTNQKGQWFLIPIFEKIKDKLPNIKLIILGEGPLKSQILCQASKAGLKCYDGPESFDRNGTKEIGDFDIFLLGFKSNTYPFLEKSSVFVLPSIYEGFPNVIIEAMACGLPIVASDCASGPREIIAPETDIRQTADGVEYAEYGILLPVLDKNNQKYEEHINLWSEAVTDVLVNPETNLRLREQALIRASHFEKHLILKKWIDVIEN
jgi:glycosyltransferase involved in cell wall biosynthesis